MTHPEVVEAFPLTPMQELMLIHTVSATEFDACFVQYNLRVEGPFDLDRYERAWQRTVDRHQILQTCFAWRDLEQPLQVVLAGVRVPFATFDWIADRLVEHDPAGADERLRSMAAGEAAKGFDLNKAPLLRLAVAQLSDTATHVVLSMHHLIVDGWSVERLLSEVASAYREDATTAAPAPGFDEYVDWLADQDVSEAELYWAADLAGVSTQSGRPAALVRPTGAAVGSDYREVRSELSASVTDSLRNRARESRVTMSTLVRAAWSLLLSRYAGSDDVVFGITLAGRPPELPGVDEMIGPLLNNAPLRVRVPAPTTPLREWLGELQRRAGEADRFQWCSPAQIHAWSGARTGTTLFESLLVYQNYPGDSSLPRLGAATTMERYSLGSGPTVRTGFPLTLTVAVDQTLALRTTHDVGFVSRLGVERLHAEIGELLTAIAEGASNIGDLPLPDMFVPRTELAGSRPRGTRAAWAAASSPLEASLVSLVEQILDLSDVGVKDDFFALGGDSVAAMHLRWRIREDLDAQLSLSEIFENPTLAGLAWAVARVNPAATDSQLLVHPTDDKDLDQ